MDVVHGSCVSELDVFLEISFLRGAVVTVWTRMRLFPGVRAHVQRQLNPRRSTVLAQLASVGSNDELVAAVVVFGK